jgi:antitoxin (DNA-binding transcriptional repressor) of toxin-antitoxin stability system
MGTKQISITEFSAHAEEELQAVEHGNTMVKIMRDGHVVAYLSPAAKPLGDSGTLADWIGTGPGFTLAPGCSLDDPAFEPEEWEEFPNDSDD